MNTDTRGVPDMLDEKLPHFRKPPVVEMVLGLQYEPLPSFGNAHLGALWQTLGEDWPHVSDVPPLDPQYEQFGEPKTWRSVGLSLTFTRGLHLRFQIRNRSNDRMIQVQNGRLHYNWLGHRGGEYPRYDCVRPEFDTTIEAVRRFLTDRSLGELYPNQWEITYVNHIPRGTVWNDMPDWLTLFPALAPLPAEGSGIRLESLAGEWHYEIEPRLGRLHVSLTHGWRATPTEHELLVLNLTARGAVQTGAGETGCTLDDGLRIGHRTIVKAFKELTSDKAHEFWELVDD